MNKRTIANRLRDVAKFYDSHGWHRGWFTNYKGDFCVLGAINEVVTTPYRSPVKAALVKHLNVYSIPDWNDRKAKSKEEVQKALRGAAMALEHGMSL